MSEYPKERAEEKCFIIWFIRLMIQEGLAQQIGVDAFCLLTTIASKEDELHYSRPPDYHVSQLLTVLGFPKWDRLNKARKEAIDSGWLHYESRGKKPGEYWVKIPRHVTRKHNLTNGASPPVRGKQESTPNHHPHNDTLTGGRYAPYHPHNDTLTGVSSVPVPEYPNPGTGANGSLKGDWKEITSERLENIDFLLEWYELASTGKPPKVPRGDTRRVEFVAAAVRSLEGTNPAGLFIKTLKNGWWNRATADHERRAKELLDEHRRRHAGPVDADLDAELTAIANRMAVPPLDMVEEYDESY